MAKDKEKYGTNNKSSAQSKPYKHKLVAGMKFGELTLVQRVRDDTKTRSGNLRIRWRVRCSCGSETFTIPQYYLTRNQPEPKTHCGGDAHRPYSAIHGQHYRIWLMMHMRCEDPSHEAYKHYGGRGIKVCAEWHKSLPDLQGFRAFVEYIGPRPSMDYSIDRIDNDLGYQPFQADGVTRQLRWATAKEQRANQRPRSS